MVKELEIPFAEGELKRFDNYRKKQGLPPLKESTEIKLTCTPTSESKLDKIPRYEEGDIITIKGLRFKIASHRINKSGKYYFRLEREKSND